MALAEFLVAVTEPSVEHVCRDCGNTFVLTAGDQRYFSERKLHQPRRCESCRDKKRESNKEKAYIGCCKQCGSPVVWLQHEYGAVHDRVSRYEERGLVMKLMDLKESRQVKLVSCKHQKGHD